MTTVFIGGSRHISALSSHVKERLGSVTKSGHRIILGDANGADKLVQKYLLDCNYEDVIIFCSGDQPRNNIGRWLTRNIQPSHGAKGFEFYAAKDRQMAIESDFGIMIWDGKSPGTILNVLRLVRADKRSVIFNESEKRAILIKSFLDWEGFLAECSFEFIADLKKRATPQEWENIAAPQQTDFFESRERFSSVPVQVSAILKTESELAKGVNSALISGDPVELVDAISHLAQRRGLIQVEKDVAQVRQSLVHNQNSFRKSEFVTLLRVFAEVGLRLPDKKSRSVVTEKRDANRVPRKKETLNA